MVGIIVSVLAIVVFGFLGGRRGVLRQLRGGGKRLGLTYGRL